MELHAATALVTGANRGIGRAIVEALVAAGAPKVYAAARDPESLAATVALAPTKVVAIGLDVTDPASIAAAAKRAPDVDLLVNNAGVLDFGSALETGDDATMRNLATNYLGPLRMARAFVPAIEANGGGAIVNVLSIVALASMPGLAVYNASKAASWSMTQSLRGSLAARGIAVFAVFPGPVDTDMAASIELAKTSPRDVARDIVAAIAAGREDVFPDPMSQQVYDAWKADHKAVEKQFAAA